MRVANISWPEGPAKNLVCQKCRFVIPDVEFYTGVDEHACRLQLERERVEETATACADCGERSKLAIPPEHYKAIVLTDYRGRQLCATCLPKAVEADTSDPSTASEKFAFNRRTMKWELVKVKQPCVDCGRQRWLSVQHRWQKRCVSCYQASIRLRP
jgi:hypothetical protein